MIGKFQTFQNHLPNQLTQNQDIITPRELMVLRVGWEFTREPKSLESACRNPHGSPRSREWGWEFTWGSRVLGVGAKVWARLHAKVKGFCKCMWKFAHESKVPHVGTKVQGSQKCKQESTQTSKGSWVWTGVHERVKGSQNCKQEFAWESKVLRVGTRIRTWVQGPRLGNESVCGGLRSMVLGVAMRVRTRVEGSRKCKWEFVQSLRSCVWGLKSTQGSKGHGITSKVHVGI
jgi:hypothetical protein